MLELKFAIYYRAASLPSQASYAVLAEESQVSSNAPHTPTVFLIQQSCVIITFSLLSDLCACVHVKKKWRRKGSHSSSVWFESPRVTSNLEKSDGLVHCSVKNAAVLCKFELARLKKKKKKKKKKKEKHFGRLVIFWFGTFAMLFSTTGCVFRHENTRR